MFIRATHLTRYTYSQPVSFAPHALYLRPRETARQRLHHFTLTLTPAAKLISTGDASENALDWAYYPPATLATVCDIHTAFLVETLDTNPFDFFLAPTATAFPFDYSPNERFALAPALTPPSAEVSPLLISWLARHLPTPPRETLPLLTALNGAVKNSLRYNRRDEPGIQSAAETIALGSGSCRDYAVLFIELCRHLGLAARFVSGYFFEAPPADGSPPLPFAMHAWAEVFLPGAGWRGLDPTHGIFCDDAFIPVAHAALAETVNPVQGGFYGTGPITSLLHHEITLEKI
jgi:transglutaminase-like putative cysteine protease